MSDFDESRERAKAAREALVGKTLAGGRYVLRSLVGHGGMGAVYAAEHVGLGKRVAVKFVDPEFATDEQVVARFAREARAMSAIESAHIVSVFDAGTEDGRPYLVMELLRGEDLGERLRRERRVPVDEAMHVAAQVLKGLGRAHAAGIIHRDLKPDNVFLVKHDLDPLFAKIVDFGVSKIERPRAGTTPLALTGRGTVLGTPFYMSPEQAQAMPDVDGRSDLYSVGAILFECLSGRPPHTGESYEQVILSICMRDAPDLRAIEPSIPKNVAEFVARALSRDRNLRFRDAGRMLAALHDVAPEERKRVPIDAEYGPTLLSVGVDVAAEISVATRLGHAPLDSIADTEKLPAPVASERSDHVAPSEPSPAPAKPKAPSRKPKRNVGVLVATAVVATLAGVLVMVGIILSLEKKPARDGVQATDTTAIKPVALPSATSSSPIEAASSSSEPLASATSATSAASSELPAGRTVAPRGTNVLVRTSASGKLPPPPSSAAGGRTDPAPNRGAKPLDIQRDLP
ncbi:serine/threonine-protein kinase [Labilithrix luteola]|nr:serine/threonine-protein kinase [Labilithrix luteola]